MKVNLDLFFTACVARLCLASLTREGSPTHKVTDHTVADKGLIVMSPSFICGLLTLHKVTSLLVRL